MGMLKIDRQTAIEQELAKNGSVLIPALSPGCSTAARRPSAGTCGSWRPEVN